MQFPPNISIANLSSLAEGLEVVDKGIMFIGWRAFDSCTILNKYLPMERFKELLSANSIICKTKSQT